MKRTLKERIVGWMGAIWRTEADSIADRLLDAQRKEHNRLIFSLHEERSRARGLERRVEELEPALAECVAALREIAALSTADFKTTSLRRRRTAQATLNRLQIPDDHLPTKGYPRDD